MEGTPLRTSAVKRIALASLVPRPNSARNIPLPMPIGIPMMLASARSTPEPTIALAMPPPVSPSGAGTLVKKFKSSELAPLKMSSAKMTASGTITRMVAKTASTVTVWSVTVLILERSSNLLVLTLLSLPRLRRRAARDRPDQQLGNCIDNNRDSEQSQGDLDQSAAVQVAGRLGKFVGDHRSH